MSRLGIFDSGLGGYTIVQAIRQRYPKQDIVFLADQKNIPYGNKEQGELKRIVMDNMEWFDRQGVLDVLIACNTASALDFGEIRARYPHLNIMKIIDLTSRQIEGLKIPEIIVIATRFTIHSHAYRDAILNCSPDTIVHEVALENMAKLIEDMASAEKIDRELSRNLAEYQGCQIPVILGCTHYPLIRNRVANYLGGMVFDSIDPILACHALYSIGKGEMTICTSGEPEVLRRQIRDLFSQETSPRGIV